MHGGWSLTGFRPPYEAVVYFLSKILREITPTITKPKSL